MPKQAAVQHARAPIATARVANAPSERIVGKTFYRCFSLYNVLFDRSNKHVVRQTESPRFRISSCLSPDPFSREKRETRHPRQSILPSLSMIKCTHRIEMASNPFFFSKSARSTTVSLVSLWPIQVNRRLYLIWNKEK